MELAVLRPQEHSGQNLYRRRCGHGPCDARELHDELVALNRRLEGFAHRSVSGHGGRRRRGRDRGPDDHQAASGPAGGRARALRAVWRAEQDAKLAEQRVSLAAGEAVRCACCFEAIALPGDAAEKHDSLLNKGDCEQQWGGLYDARDDRDEEPER